MLQVVFSKIDEKDCDDFTKEVLKEMAKDLVEQTFARLKEEYDQLTQKEIENDAEKITVSQIDSISAALKNNLKN